ncbi:MAG: glycosyltransferase family 4 protein, partial [Chloroflexota bacterium]|nr:glycosyltransferase family 4 protein [Chloroflexota bacterium]
MRIAYLCSDAGVPIGGQKGASVHVGEMTRALAGLGHEVRIFARRAASPRLPDGVSLFVPPPDAMDIALERWLRDDPAAGAAETWTVATIAGASSFRQRTRDAVRAFAPDLIYERYALFGATGAALAEELSLPFVLEVNAPLSEEQATHRGLAFPNAARSMERHILGKADRVVAVSSALASWLEGQGVAPSRIMVVPNGVDPERFDTSTVTGERRTATRLRLGLTDRPVVGFVGTLKPWHDVAALLHAVALLRKAGTDVSLLLVGDGPERSALEALAVELHLSRDVVFAGAVPHEGVVDLLSVMDVAVAPYREQEGFYFSPLKLFEYLAAGLPVVSARLGDIAHCVHDDTGGWTYAPGDVSDLAHTVLAALRDAPE